jgi:ATP-binding cassette subfamily F protein uup
LNAGWNLVSPPLTLGLVNTSVFKGTNVTMVARYNRSTSGFDIYRVGKTPVPFPMEAGQGYFLFSNNNTTFTLTGRDASGQSTTYTDIKESGVLEGISNSIGQRLKEKDDSTENKAKAGRDKEKPLKFSYKEQKEYEEIDDIIALLEGRAQELDNQIAGAASDYILLQQLMKEKEELESQLEEKMERWVYLNELAERIAKNK